MWNFRFPGRPGVNSIERVDAFEDDDLIFLQAQFAAFVEAGAGVKVEGGQVNFLASVQRGQVAVENFDVHGVEVFKVVFPGGAGYGRGPRNNCRFRG